MKTFINCLLISFLAFTSVSCKFKPGGDTFEIKKWNECTKSSNWTGSNASKRMMNILSPKMPDSVFRDRINFIKGRGCNTVHLILCNKADGEYSGYSIYGSSIDWSIDKSYTDVMGARIQDLHKQGFGIVFWLVTDDDGGWNKTLAGNFSAYVNDIKNLGWFKYASTVVLGLELNEYWSANQVTANMVALMNAYTGKTGVHMTSGKWDWVQVADILFYQTAPGKSASQIENETKNVVAKCKGKPVCFFELERSENRSLCEAAFRGGAFSVGNW